MQGTARVKQEEADARTIAKYKYICKGTWAEEVNNAQERPN